MSTSTFDEGAGRPLVRTPAGVDTLDVMIDLVTAPRELVPGACRPRLADPGAARGRQIRAGP